MSKENDVEKIAEFFKVLGDPTRLEIVKLLAEFGDLCVGAIADKVSVTQPAVSQHLKLLKHAGVVISRKMGFYIHYSLNYDIINQYRDQLSTILNKDINNKCFT